MSAILVLSFTVSLCAPAFAPNECATAGRQDGPTVELPKSAQGEPDAEAQGSKNAERRITAPPKRPDTRKLVRRGDAGTPGAGTMVFWTLFVLALLGGLFVLLKRYVRRGNYLGAGVIEILARKPLSQKHQIFLVEVGSKIFLVGAAKDRLVTLGEFSGPEEVAAIRSQNSSRKTDSVAGSFHTSLREGLREVADRQKNPR